MSPKARREYVEDMRRRYAAAPLVQRSALLDEVVAVTGYHRKYVIALLRAQPRTPKKRRRRYGPDVAAALIEVWKAAGYPWSARLKAMLPLWLPWLMERDHINQQTHTALMHISTRTIDRLLRAKRGEVRRRLYGHTRPGSLLKHQIPIRAERWNVNQAGWVELDLVAHCDDNGFGEFVNSLNLTDIATGWTETRAICGKSQRVTIAAIDAIRSSLPFVLQGIDSDNGSEFIDEQCVRYCNTEPKLQFTRGRPYKKNDNAHVEQKNWTHVRKIFGWQRLAGQAVADAMNEVYAGELRIWMNFFQPCVQLVERERIGSRVKKRYDAPQTPLDRLIALGSVDAERASALRKQREGINPFDLARAIELKVEAILKMPQEPPRRRPHAHTGGLRFEVLTPKVVATKRAAQGSPGKILYGETG